MTLGERVFGGQLQGAPLLDTGLAFIADPQRIGETKLRIERICESPLSNEIEQAQFAAPGVALTVEIGKLKSDCF